MIPLSITGGPALMSEKALLGLELYSGPPQPPKPLWGPFSTLSHSWGTHSGSMQWRLVVPGGNIHVVACCDS